MYSENKNIGKLLRKYGYAFPETEEEVEAFEKKYKGIFSNPSSWPDLSDIINETGSSIPIIQLNNAVNKSVSNLAMAAREGKEISKKDREQMNKDKKDARKK
ncbi:hypothetical protein [Maribacter sp.]|uniref:hypothetical protein n=1 Tax=Maribacter sp. TaxID=1897614 RepID=UPI0025B7EC74|nr:hypothetical protein [Maribacter sp.]